MSYSFGFVLALEGTSRISKNINVYEESIKSIFNFQLFHLFEGCRVWCAGYGAWFVGFGV